MKIWIFEYAKVTDSYHSGGGLVFLAKNREQVLALLPPGAELTEEDWDRVRVIDDLSHEFPEVFVFPDSGCC